MNETYVEKSSTEVQKVEVVDEVAVRRVLKSWHDSKVIGQEQLAQLRIVQHQRLQSGYGETNEGNALALRDVFQNILDEVKALARPDDLTDDQWVYVVILTEQFINRRKSNAVQDELALGRRAFFNKQKQALTVVAQKLAEREAQHSSAQDIAAPPETVSPPDVHDFVGRSQELAYFQQKLAELNYAVIVGFPGAGKTLLAAKLAREVAPLERVFWYQCRAGDSVESLLWALASFLVSCGEEKLWRILYRSSEQTGQDAMPLNVRIDYAMRLLEKRDYLICLDDFQTIADDLDVVRFATQLHELTQTNPLRMVITSRVMPPFVRLKFDPLAGLRPDDIKLLIAAHTLDLQSEQAADLHTALYKATDGHPLFLNLALDVLRETGDVDELLARLPQEENVEQYLLQTIDRQLSHDERVVMGGLAVLGDYGGDRSVIEVIIGGGSIRRPLRGLSMRNLLTVSLGPNGREYGQHAIVRTFYYEELGLRERKAMHRRAGEYFADTGRSTPDSLRAARQYLQADETILATQLAVQAVETQLHRGYAQQLRHLFEEIDAPDDDDLLAIQLCVGLGRVYAYLREVDLAQAKYEEVLEKISTIGDEEDARTVEVRVCRLLAALLKSTAPAEALKWAQRGLEIVDDSERMQKAELLVSAGVIQMKLGDTDTAREALEKGLALSSATPNHTHQLALIRLGIYYFLQNDFTRSEELMQKALQLAQAADQPLNALTSLSNLAILHHSSGDWTTASDYYAQASDVAEELYDSETQARLGLSLGVLRLNMGDHLSARQYLTTAQELACRGSLFEIMVPCLAYLADLRLVQSDMADADAALTEAHRLAAEKNIEYQLPFLAYLRASYHLALKAYAEGARYAREAIDIAKRLGMDQERGLGLRVLGQSQLHMDKIQEATDSFQQSIDLLASNPYECARTKDVWGSYLFTGTDPAAGREMLLDAQQQYELLGADRDLAEIMVLLDTNSLEN